MSYTVALSEDVLPQIEMYRKKGQTAVLRKIQRIKTELEETPFEGIGKPEPLKHNLAGLWSRRLTDEHRIVYQIENGTVIILSVAGHYE